MAFYYTLWFPLKFFSGQWRFWYDTTILGTWVSILNYFFLLKIDQWNCAESNMIQFLNHSFKVIFSLIWWDLTWYNISCNSDTSCFSRLCFISALISTLTFLLLGIPLPILLLLQHTIRYDMIWCSHSIMLFISYFWQYPEIKQKSSLQPRRVVD